MRIEAAFRRPATFLLAAAAGCQGLVAQGGGPSAPGDGGDPVTVEGGAGPSDPVTAAVVISEIMYRPVAENADEESHEFVEIYNRGKTAVALDGWILESGKGGVLFTFPSGTTIAPGQYRVVAKNGRRLAEVAKYGLVEGDLLGDYAGELGNGGATLALHDGPNAPPVDAVKYDDHFPWPLAADELGVGEDWLPPDQRPLIKHQYMGRSLERISADFASGSPANWEASPLDGATPGRPNSVAGTVAPIVEACGATPAGGEGAIIRSNQRVTVAARFSAPRGESDVEVEYFVDDVRKSTFAPLRKPMVPGADGAYAATLDPQKDNAVVRYRIRATRASQSGVVAPRATDPLPRANANDPDGWFTYFVSPKILIKSGPRAGTETTAKVFHAFIKPADWTLLETWLAKRRTSDYDGAYTFTMGGCDWNPDWDSTVPVTLISDGKAYDARARYEGGWFNRAKGFPIPQWPYPGPKLPAGKATLLALSWKIYLPRYDRPSGMKSLLLKKHWQGCPGTVTWVEGKILENAGLAAQKSGGQPIPTYQEDFARLHINGGYYHYMENQEDIDDGLVTRVYGDGPMGDLYKNVGSNADLGPTGRGDFDYQVEGMKPNPFCPKFSPYERYAATYERKTYEYRSYDEIIKLIADLTDARHKDAAAREQGALGTRNLKAYFEKYWEVDTLLGTYAIRNWSAPHDDVFHNMNIYKNPGTGKWVIIPNDFEWDFGLGNYGESSSELTPANYSVFNPRRTLYWGWRTGADPCIWKACGLQTAMCDGDVGANSCDGGTNYNALKDALIGTYKNELDAKFRELVRNDILSAKAVLALIDEGVARFSMDDWNDAPTDRRTCDPVIRHQAMRTWAEARHATVVERLKP